MSAITSRLLVVTTLLCLVLSLIVVRLVSIQVVHSSEYSQRSRDQTLQRRMVKAPRGRILDRRGRELATSLGDEGRLGGVEEGRVDRGGRFYPHGELAAPLLGFVGRDGCGMGGAELSFDRWLRGEDGWVMVQRDARIVAGRQRKYATGDLPSKPPVPGADVYLTIDLDIQSILHSVLTQTREQCAARGAMGMVMDPATGRILAMANVPGFDPNHASRYGLDERVNRCIGGNYEPGSTFKLVAATAALQERLLRESDTLDASNGVYMVYGEAIRDHERLGRISFADALAHSSNVCFAKIADKLGSDLFYRYTRNYGFGERTGIPLPGEEAGVVHPMREWSGRTRVTMAMGQEVMATLLQMMMLYAAVANDGVLLQPRICEKVTDASGDLIESPEAQAVRRVASASVSRRLTKMLRQVVNDGTGARAAIEGVDVAGKTGTSQKFDHTTRAYSDSLYYASFIGYAPADRPLLLCGIVVDEPHSVSLGGLVAAPAFRRVVAQVISHPGLEYAEAMLQGRGNPVVAQQREAVPAQQAGVALPVASGLPLAEAQRCLARAGLRAEVVGDGDSVVHQSPRPGAVRAAGGVVTLYTQRSAQTGPRQRVSVPDCRGRDMREALSLLCLRGLVPFVKGAGFVREQMPAAGSMREQAQACTLYCSFEI